MPLRVHAYLVRVLALVLAILALCGVVTAVSRWSVLISPLRAETPTPAIQISFLSHDGLIGLIPNWMRSSMWGMVAFAIALPAIVGISLQRASPENVPARNLCHAMSALSFVLSYWCIVLPRNFVSSPLLGLSLDIAGSLSFVWFLRSSIAFCFSFPRTVDFEGMVQYYRREEDLRRQRIAPWHSKLERLFPFLQSRRDTAWYRTLWLAVFSIWVPLAFGAIVCAATLLTRFSSGTVSKAASAVSGLGVFAASASAVVVMGHPFLWSLRTGSEEERRKIYWVCWGAVASFWAAATLPWVGLFIGSYVWFIGLLSVSWTWVVIIVSTALLLATYFQGSLDPRLAISRTMVIGALGVVIPPVALGLGKLLEHGIFAKLALPAHSSLWASIGVALFVYRPVGRRIEGWMDARLENWLPASALAGAHRLDRVVGIVDLSGYTRLSAEDESAALTHASALRKSAISVARPHGTRVVKSLGDAALWECEKSDSAISFCRATEAHYRQEVTAESLTPLSLHFAIHRGEVVVARDGDIFGQTVNIASRMVATAGPGEIVISAAVATVLDGAKAIVLEPLGPRELKGVSEAIRCFRVK